MSDYPTRSIHTVKTHLEIADLLQSIYVCELLMPSEQIWLVSPWISDIPILDNRSNSFTSLAPNWSRKKITLSELLAKLVQMGSTLHVITRPDSHNERFLGLLRERTGKLYEDRLHVQSRTHLHAKGLLGDGYYLSGSMNFTFNGIEAAEDNLQFITDPALVAENRLQFISYRKGRA